jgi:hypothetical protein
LKGSRRREEVMAAFSLLQAQPTSHGCPKAQELSKENKKKRELGLGMGLYRGNPNPISNPNHTNQTKTFTTLG